MNFKRIGRILVCLVLVCALLINISPIKAKADAITGAAIVKASTVTCNPYIICAAILIACGLYAGTQTAAFDNLVSNCVDAMAAAGTWIQNGAAELYRVVTDTGEAVYYADTAMMEAVRSWTFDSGAVSSGVRQVSAGSSFVNVLGETISSSAELSIIRFSYLVGYNVQFIEACFSHSGAAIYVDGIATGTGITIDGQRVTYRAVNIGSSYGGFVYVGTQNTLGNAFKAAYQQYLSGAYDDIYFADGLTLGNVLSVPIDGTSARTWSETYANRGLYIASGGNQGAPDDGAEGNDGWKFLLPLTLASAAILAAMSQTEQWTGTTSPEFDDYTEKEELTVTPAPEFDDYPAIEIAPVTNPNPDPDTGTDPGTGSDSDSGGDSAESTWWQRLYQWLLEIKTSINELPNRFDEHFENLNNNIQEAPNKFETWIQNVQTSVDAVAESILGTADEINAAISNLPNAFSAHVQNILSAIAAVPQAILSGIQTVLQNLFVPDPEFIPNKVEALKAEYKFLDPMLDTGEDLKLFFQNIGSQPPIIWIDLGAGTGWHPMGGKVKFIDLTWYAQYKPTVDPIVGGFIWLWVAWRLFKGIPGLLSGDSGTVGAPTVAPDFTFNQARLPAGRSRRKKDGE